MPYRGCFFITKAHILLINSAQLAGLFRMRPSRRGGAAAREIAANNDNEREVKAARRGGMSSGQCTFLCVMSLVALTVYLVPPPSGHPLVRPPLPDVLIRPDQMEDRSGKDWDALRHAVPPELGVHRAPALDAAAADAAAADAGAGAVTTTGKKKRTIAWAVTVSKGSSRASCVWGARKARARVP